MIKAFQIFLILMIGLSLISIIESKKGKKFNLKKNRKAKVKGDNDLPTFKLDDLLGDMGGQRQKDAKVSMSSMLGLGGGNDGEFKTASGQSYTPGKNINGNLGNPAYSSPKYSPISPPGISYSNYKYGYGDHSGFGGGSQNPANRNDYGDIYKGYGATYGSSLQSYGGGSKFKIVFISFIILDMSNTRYGAMAYDPSNPNANMGFN